MLKVDIDNLYKLELELSESHKKLEKTKIYKQVEDLKENITLLRDKIVNSNTIEQMSTTSGKKAYLDVQEKDSYTVANWDQVISYIENTRDFDILQKRVLLSTVRKRVENGKAIPGIQSGTKVIIKVRGLDNAKT